MTVTHLTNENFESEVLDSEIPVVVDFWAEWCGPCQMMGPVFEELSSEFEGKLKFAKLNVEEAGEVASRFGISGIPALVVVKGKEELGRIVGFNPKDEMKAKLEELI